MHPVEFSHFAPIGNRIDRDVEQLGCRLRTRATITALPAWTRCRPQRTPTLQAIGVAQPLDLASRKRTALPTAIALVIETLGNPDIGVIPGQLREALDDLGRRVAHHIRRFGPRHF